MKTIALVCLLAVVSVGCTTPRQSKITMGVGLGIAATGGLLIASEGDGDMGTAYTAAGLGILGAVVVGVGLLGYGVTSLQQRFPPPGASRKSTKP